jgi:outer membrane lipoprotein SlyB
MKLEGIMKKIAQLTIGIMLFTSCARQISSDVYSARQVGEVSTTIPGYVRNVREVCMEQGEQLQDNELGVAGGGVAGGVVGHAIGRGKFVPTAVGAVAGAVSGAFLEKKLKEQLALEYIIQLDNGSLITVVQGKDHLFTIGQPVYVIVSQSGRSRIIPQ